jgi:hypothetical protein
VSPIGRPLADLRVEVVDPYGTSVACGGIGEIMVSGAGVARGYANDPRLTADRFQPDPVGARGGRRYASGDLARQAADGALEYLGRQDAQLKLRGFRIEPAEIEHALREDACVEEAVVRIRGERARPYLVAYVVARGRAAIDPAKLRAMLAHRLPVYMLPDAFVAVDALPRTRNGKLDEERLPAPAGPGVASAGAIEAPHTSTERAIAEVWSQVLALPQVGADQPFFEIGGTSILLVDVHARLQGRFDRRLDVVDLIRHPTIASLAAFIDGRDERAGDGEAAAGRRAAARALAARHRAGR